LVFPLSCLFLVGGFSPTHPEKYARSDRQIGWNSSSPMFFWGEHSPQKIWRFTTDLNMFKLFKGHQYVNQKVNKNKGQQYLTKKKHESNGE